MRKQDLNRRLALAPCELLIIGHEHQRVHRHVSLSSQLLRHRAFVSIRLLYCEGAGGVWGNCRRKEMYIKRGDGLVHSTLY